MHAIGIDIGGTNMRLARVDLDTGRVIERAQQASFVGDAKAGISALISNIRVVSGNERLPVGIAIAAQLDPKRRVALMAPNLKWQNVPLAAALEKALRCKVCLENDVRSAAIGELRFGALRKAKGTAAAAFWGSGIGGAVIAEGRLQSGALALAGEIGHLAYKPGGRVCGCGKKGCFEAYIGGHNLAVRTRRRNHELLDAADAGEKKAQAQVAAALAIFGLQLSHIANLLDPDAIVIGGGLGLRLFARIGAEIAPHLLPVRHGKVTLRKARLGDDSGILGAAALARAGREQDDGSPKR